MRMEVIAFLNSQLSSSIFDILFIMSAMLISSTFEPVGDTCTRPMLAGSRAEEDMGGREDDDDEDRGRRGDADDD